MVCPGVELPQEVHAGPENHPQDGEAPGQDARDGVAAPGVQQVRQAPLRARPRHLHRQQEGGGAAEGTMKAVFLKQVKNKMFNFIN